jgi:hypothetical protein
MTLPIAIEVHEGAGYVRYRDDEVASTIDLMESCSVAADVASNDDVIGIEILDIASDDQLEVAKRFALERGLGFPRDLAGALVDDPHAAHA